MSRKDAALFSLALLATGAQADFRTDLKGVGVALAEWNRGLMMFLQATPDDFDTICQEKVANCIGDIIDLFDLDTYPAQEFDVFEAFDKYSIMQIKIVQEWEACGFDAYLTRID